MRKFFSPAWTFFCALVVIIALSFFSAYEVFAAPNPVFDATSSSASVGSGTLTWSHTVTALGTDKVLVVMASNRNVCTSGLLTSVTYAGVGMTRLGSAFSVGSNTYNEMWYLVNPATGANNVVINSANGGCAVLSGIATSWTDVDQVDPFGAVATTLSSNVAGSYTTSVSGTVTSDVVIGSIITNNGSTVTFSGGTTLVDNESTHYVMQTTATDTSTTINYTTSGFSDYVVVAAPMHVSSGGVPPTTYDITGFVFSDGNGNGIKNTWDSGYNNATVTLTGDASGSTTSSVTGAYSFEDLDAGDYTVTVTVPVDYTATTDVAVPVTLSSNTTVNFGIQSDDAGSGLAGAPTAMPVISWGEPAFASTEDGTSVASNVTVAPGDETTNTTYDIFGLHSWASTAVPAWIAIDLSGVSADERAMVDVVWHNSTNAYDCCSIGSGGTYNGLPRDYTIEANAGAGGGAAPGSGWVTLQTVTGNTYRAREHIVDLTGYNWVRLNVSAVNGSDDYVELLHFDVHDLSASAGVAEDSWLFIGDSITLGSTNYADVFFGSQMNFTIPIKINEQLSTHFPVQIDGGIVGASVADGVANFDDWIADFPGRYVGIAYGTNDATSGTSDVNFYNRYSTLIETVINEGKVPIVPKIPWASSAGTQANVPRLNAVIDDLYTDYPEVIQGPNFYEYFFDNQSEIGSGDVHPAGEGYPNMRKMWACSMLVNIYGVASATVFANPDCSPFEDYIPLEVVNTPPTISITAPTDGQTVSGTINLTATAAATNPATVVSVQFRVDGVNTGSPDTSSPYSISWDSTGVADGARAITAVVIDSLDETTTSSAINITVDNTAPVRSSGAPSGELTLGTTNTNITLTTNENATCKYSTSAATAYGSMTNFNTTGTTSHSSPIVGLSNGGSYTYYVKCQDGQSNTNATDYEISFTVDDEPVTPPPSGGGGGGGGGSRARATVKPINNIDECLVGHLFSIYTGLPCSTVNNSIVYPSTTRILGPIFLSRNYALNDTSEEIRMLQKYLNDRGFLIALSGAGSPGFETSYFGRLTYNAVIKFQATAGLPATGFVGPLTRAMMAI